MRTEDDEDHITVVIFLSCLRLLFECVAIPTRVYRLSVFCWFAAASDESTTFLQYSVHFVDHGDTIIEMIRSLLKNKGFMLNSAVDMNIQLNKNTPLIAAN